MDIRSFATRLYVTDLNASDDFFGNWYDRMPEERKKRCDRFKFEADKKRCIMAYALLVFALGELGFKGSDTVAISQEADEKPYLADIPVHFNISHAKERVAVAVSPMDVGCDVECKSGNALSVAKRFFASEEYSYLESVADEDLRKSEFTKIWTMKESVIKCCGEGIRRSLDDFACTDESGNRNKTIILPGIGIRYHVREYESESGYCYSVCGINETIEDDIRRISFDQSGE